MSSHPLRPSFFQVESILARRKIGRKFQYKIKWKGFSEAEATWEPLRNLTDLEDVIAIYDKAIENGEPADNLTLNPQSVESKSHEKQQHETHLAINPAQAEQKEESPRAPNERGIQSKQEIEQKKEQEQMRQIFALKEDFFEDLIPPLQLKPASSANYRIYRTQQLSGPKAIEISQEAHSMDISRQSRNLHQKLSHLAAKIGHCKAKPEPVSKRTRKQEKIDLKKVKSTTPILRLNKTYDLELKEPIKLQQKFVKGKSTMKKPSPLDKGPKKAKQPLDKQQKNAVKTKLLAKIEAKSQLKTTAEPTTIAKQDPQSQQEIISVRRLEKVQLKQAECLVTYSNDSLQVMTLGQLAKEHPEKVLAYLSRSTTPSY